MNRQLKAVKKKLRLEQIVNFALGTAGVLLWHLKNCNRLSTGV